MTATLQGVELWILTSGLLRSFVNAPEVRARDPRSDSHLHSRDLGRAEGYRLAPLSAAPSHTPARPHVSRLPRRDASPLRALPRRDGPGRSDFRRRHAARESSSWRSSRVSIQQRAGLLENRDERQDDDSLAE